MYQFTTSWRTPKAGDCPSSPSNEQLKTVNR